MTMTHWGHSRESTICRRHFKAFSHEDCCDLLKIPIIQSGIWNQTGSTPSFEPMVTQNGDTYSSRALAQRLTMASPTQLCWRHHGSPIGRRHIPRPQWVKDVIGKKWEIGQYTLMHYIRKGLYTNMWELHTAVSLRSSNWERYMHVC